MRKAGHRALMKEGDKTLKNSKFDWLRDFPGLHYEPTFKSLYNANLETSKAWRLKESFAGFWDYLYEGSAARAAGKPFKGARLFPMICIPFRPERRCQ